MGRHVVASNDYTSGIAAFRSTLRLEDIPSEAIGRIELLDSPGGAVSAAGLPWSRIRFDTRGALDTSRGCTVRVTAASADAACKAKAAAWTDRVVAHLYARVGT